MASHKARVSLSLLLLLVVLMGTTEAPDPCCLRVTPYHIQALAQRMAQRFQALEYRAHDLRGVFAAFQAVHGNVSHRLRYLEMEHAHLGEMVSRLDSRVQTLEEEKKREEYRHRVGFYRTRRGAAVDAGHSNKHHLYKAHLKTSRFPVYATHMKSEERRRAYPLNSFRKSESEKPHGTGERRLAFPYVRLRRHDMPIVLPPLRVHLDQAEEPAPDMTSQELLPTAVSSVDGEAASSPSPSDSPREHQESAAWSEKRASAASPTELEASASASSSSSAVAEASQPLFVGAEAAAAASNDVMSGGGTTPTPLWQLEESADALLQAMSAGDEDESLALTMALSPDGEGEREGGADNDHDDESVSFWAPANETDSLERLYAAANAVIVQPKPTSTTANTHRSGTEASRTNVSHDSSTTTTTTVTPPDAQNTLDSLPSPSDTNGTTTSDIDNTIPGTSTAKATSGCHSTHHHHNFSLPTPTNDTSVMDLLIGNGSTACEGAGCETPAPVGPNATAEAAELSDAELQEALKELDALLQQRPPSSPTADAESPSAPPPDPEKLLLKRALTLALAALERTSDACLTLVNFTADAFEGLAAAEGMAEGMAGPSKGGGGA